MDLHRIGDDTWFVDLNWLDQPEYIATAVLRADDGLVLIDPGPTSALSGLEAGLQVAGHRLEDVQTILLTHIHLDHAGVTGTLAGRNPALRVFVHESGTRHLLDPRRLLASAERIYGDRMESLWGAFDPVPASQLFALHGGETLPFGERVLDVAYTPGHAWHHVAYRDHSTGIAFVGDVAGERFPGSPMVLPALPPPDIDIGELTASLDTVRAWHPSRLFLTHFGPFADVDQHLDQYRTRLEKWADWVRARVDDEGKDDEHARAFSDWVLSEYARSLPAGIPNRAHRDAIAMCWYGLARYWRKAF